MRNLIPPNLFVRWLLLSWEVVMSASPAQVVALSVVRLVGMGARRMRRTRTSDSVAGFMQQGLLRIPEKCRQSGKAMVYNGRGRMLTTFPLQLKVLIRYLFFRGIALVFFLFIFLINGNLVVIDYCTSY